MRTFARTAIKQIEPRLTSASGVLYPARPRNRILYYHSVDPIGPYSHRPDAFREQLEFLLSLNYEFVTISEVASKQSQDRPWIAITFDDGYEDNATHAAPILSSLGIVATFFVVAGVIGLHSSAGQNLVPNRKMLDANSIRELHVLGMEIGSHGLTHQLASTYARRDYPGFLSEAYASRQLLSEVCGDGITAFAYPNGQKGSFSAESSRALRSAGYASAATTLWGTVSPSSDLMTLPRCEASARDSLEIFKRKILGAYDYRFVYHRLFRRSRLWGSYESID